MTLERMVKVPRVNVEVQRRDGAVWLIVDVGQARVEATMTPDQARDLSAKLLNAAVLR